MGLNHLTKMMLFLGVLGLTAAVRHGSTVAGTVSEGVQYGASFELPGGWEPRQPPYRGIVLSYAYAGSDAAVDMAIRPSEGAEQATGLSWESLFAPQYASIRIESEGLADVGGVPGKYCIYTVRDGVLKRAIEKKFPMKYLNYVFIEKGALYSVTFTDRESDFAGHLVIFRQAIQSLKFVSLPATGPGAKGRGQ